MFRKCLSLALTLIVAAGMLSFTANAAQSLSITLDGRTVAADPAPFIDSNGRTMVPVKFISDALAAEVFWNPATREVTVMKGSANINLAIGSRTITVNGSSATMDTAAMIRDGRTFVPVKYIAEALELNVGWDGATKTVMLTTGSANVGTEFPDIGEALYKNVSIRDILYEAPQDALGEPLNIGLEGMLYYYDALEIFYDKDSYEGGKQVHFFDMSLLTINGITLDKTRSELITLLGEPVEYYEYPDYAYNASDDNRVMRYHGLSYYDVPYIFIFLFSDPDNPGELPSSLNIREFGQ